MSGRPTLSALMPNYNHGRFLAESVAAILEQSYPVTELVVVDDGSTDHSVEVLDGLAAGDARVRVIRNEHNLGVIPNLNRLLEEATGDYVVFCAADDVVLPDFFSRSMSMLTRHPDAGLSSGLAVEMDDRGNVLGLFPTPIVSRHPTFLPPADVQRLLVRLGSWVMGNTVVFRREALCAAGGFVPALGAHTDGFAYMLVALRHGACYIPEPLAVWRRLPSGYAAGQAGDVDAFLGIRETAIGLMMASEPELFPPALIERWAWGATLTAGRFALQRPEAGLDDVRRLVAGRFPGERLSAWRLRLTLAALPLARRLGRRVAEAVLVVRFPSSHVAARRIHRLVHRRRARAALARATAPGAPQR